MTPIQVFFREAAVPTPYRRLHLAMQKSAFTVFLPVLLFSNLFGCTTHPEFSSVKSAHCFAGCPLGPTINREQIVRSIYTLSYNDKTRIADWVAYAVNQSTIGIAAGLSRTPMKDELVSNAIRLDEYEALGDTLQIERGQLVPLVNFAGTPFWEETNYLSVMVPRKSDLTRGAWFGLDWAVRNLASREGPVFVLVGPTFKTKMPPAERAALSAQLTVPSGFFVIVANDNKVSGFLFDQNQPIHVHHCEKRASLTEIAKETNLTFFPNLKHEPVETLDSQLGCI